MNCSIKFILGVIVTITLGTTSMIFLQQTVNGWIDSNTVQVRNTVAAVFENDIYVTWVNDNNPSGNGEVYYRVSNDAGKSFTDKINLSNTPKADSVDVEIAADEGKVVVSWWEHTQKTNEPVMRVSRDGGKTFGPILNLATNGTISN
jgi:hypothetical protein